MDNTRSYAPHLATAEVEAKQCINGACCLCLVIPRTDIPYTQCFGEQTSKPRVRLLSGILFMMDAIIKTIRDTTVPGTRPRSRILFEQLVSSDNYIRCTSEKRYPDASKEEVQTVIWVILEHEPAHQLQATLEAIFTEIQTKDSRKTTTKRVIFDPVSKENIRTPEQLGSALGYIRETDADFEYAMTDSVPQLMEQEGHLLWYLAPPSSPLSGSVSPLQRNPKVRMIESDEGNDGIRWQSPYPEDQPYFLYDFGLKPYCLYPLVDKFAFCYYFGIRPDPDKWRRAVLESFSLHHQTSDMDINLADYETEDLVRGVSDFPAPAQVTDPAYKGELCDKSTPVDFQEIMGECQTPFRVEELKRYSSLAKAVQDMVGDRNRVANANDMNIFFDRCVNISDRFFDEPGNCVPEMYSILRLAQGRLKERILRGRQSLRKLNAFIGKTPYEIEKGLDCLWKRHFNLTQAQASVASLIFIGCCLPVLADSHLVHIQLNGIAQTGKSHAVRTVLSVVPEEVVVQQDYASALAATLGTQERGVISIDEAEDARNMDGTKLKILKSLTENGFVSSERTIQNPITGKYETQKTMCLGYLFRIETGNYTITDPALRSRFAELTMPSNQIATNEPNPDRITNATEAIQWVYLSSTVFPLSLYAIGSFTITTSIDQVFRSFLSKRDPLFPVPSVRDSKKIVTMAKSQMLMRLNSAFGNTEDSSLRAKQIALNAWVSASDIVTAYAKFSNSTNQSHIRTVLRALRTLIKVDFEKNAQGVIVKGNVVKNNGYYQLQSSAGIYTKNRAGFCLFTRTVCTHIEQINPQGRPSDGLVDRTLDELMTDSDSQGRPILIRLSDENNKMSMGLRCSDDCTVLTPVENAQVRFFRNVQAGFSARINGLGTPGAFNSYDEKYYVMGTNVLDKMTDPDADGTAFSDPILSAEIERLMSDRSAFKAGPNMAEQTPQILAGGLARLQGAGIIGIKNVVVADYTLEQVEGSVPSVLIEGRHKSKGSRFAGRLVVRISYTVPNKNDDADDASDLLRDFVSLASDAYEGQLIPLSSPLSATKSDVLSITIPQRTSSESFKVPDHNFSYDDEEDFLFGNDQEEIDTPQFFSGATAEVELRDFEEKIQEIHFRRLFPNVPLHVMREMVETIGKPFPRDRQNANARQKRASPTQLEHSQRARVESDEESIVSQTQCF